VFSCLTGIGRKESIAIFIAACGWQRMGIQVAYKRSKTGNLLTTKRNQVSAGIIHLVDHASIAGSPSRIKAQSRCASWLRGRHIAKRLSGSILLSAAAFFNE